MNFLRIFKLLLFVMFIGFAGKVSAKVPTVFVSIVPQKYFAQQVCKDRVHVEVMVQPGASPATYEPRPSQMAKLAGSKAFFAIGVPFENSWLERIAGINPAMKIIHTDAGIEKMMMAAHFHEGEEREADDHNEHDMGGTPDPHIWLSPALVEKQMETILTGLTELFPEHKEFFDANGAVFLERVRSTDEQIRELLQGSRGSQFMVFHPSWGYFARDYDLQQVPVEFEGKEPKPAQVAELIEHAREKNIRVIFAQPQFSRKSAGIIAREIGGKVLIADPLSLDWDKNLLEVAQKISEAAK